MLLPHRIPVPLQPGARDTCLTCGKLVPRKDDMPPNTAYIVVGIIAALFVLVIVGFCFTRYRMRSRQGNAKRGKYKQTSNSETIEASTPGSRRRDGASGSLNSTSDANRNSTASQVDRNTSVRSVITLPAYRTKANETEQVIGREGERGGVDVVVELPTAEDLENMRDEEMEALFQIRLARRQQRDEREERRRLTREARDRGDFVALNELAAQRRAARDNNAVDDLRDAYGQIKERRERAVSSVSYHELGVAQLNGTRVRAGSHGSENVGLLSDAASIALSTRSPSAQSHRRDRSASSVMSIDSDFPSPAIMSGASTPRQGSNHTRAGSSPEIIGEADLGDSEMPPPDYEDVSLDDARSGAGTPLFNEPPPVYTDPTDGRERRLSAQVGGMVNRMTEGGDLSTTNNSREEPPTPRSSRGVGGAPQLPSLRISRLPQIVIEPSTAHPTDSHP
ncbi:uncharacterized protein F4822DRAFT_426216 [Hypoxylon trugodes]|uniref:uncharacterized protein n=1 Tax=Hypoxylon trugodes TaxID=326681 RepID=UPI00218E4EF2|nr:uncharacterized protein F4822DRAFT_426216 [Hypoxylon trugodes]KAI1393021.1 hypothetical protein F4822DRAFT_426216 [Hypoxylon trugodes]